MGDEDQAFDEGFGTAEADIAPAEERGGGLLGGLLLKILKYAAMAIGAVIFIVTVVIITMRIINRGAQPQAMAPVSPEYQGKVEKLDWYDNIPEIRGRTSDENPVTVIVKVNVGYEQENKMVQSELIARTPRLQALIRSYFASKTAAELTPQHEDTLTAELEERINRIMTDGKIKEVIFLDFNVVEF